MANKTLFGRPRESWPIPEHIWKILDDAEDRLKGRQTMSQNTLSTLTRAVSEFYKSDSTKPGVLVSWLPAEETHYVAVHRYFNSAGREKEVVVSTKDDDLDTAIDCVARQFLDIVGRPETEIDRLRRVVKQ
jgi:DNA-binding NtrC family response regulator